MIRFAGEDFPRLALALGAAMLLEMALQALSHAAL